ncbi:MAG: efflux RND transporter periplasmic adaptor subunit [Spirochaetaceae bacterium]|nr:MAG: efflux RND transporter periplasmic adaptor subunit [Spirochaetaceae bacterium]
MKTTKRLKKVFSLGTSAVVLAAVLLGCGNEVDARTEASAAWVMEQVAELGPRPVEGVPARLGAVAGEIVASGTIRGAREVVVVAETQGVLEAVGFKLGDTVAQGDVLARFDDSIEALSADEAQQVLETARLELASTERLAQSGGASQTQLAAARSSLAGARARYERAVNTREARTVRAPIGGRIASVDAAIAEGNYVNANTRVARIIDTTELEISLSVGEREVQAVTPGQPVFVTIPAAQIAEVAGRVHAVAAGSDQQTGSFSVVVRWRNSDPHATRAGLTATVRIPRPDAEERIVIPAQALQARGAARFVFVASDDGYAERRSVVVGERQADRVEIVSGLQVGEMVIVSGITGLIDGARVAVTSPAAVR